MNRLINSLCYFKSILLSDFSVTNLVILKEGDSIRVIKDTSQTVMIQ